MYRVCVSRRREGHESGVGSPNDTRETDTPDTCTTREKVSQKGRGETTWIHRSLGSRSSGGVPVDDKGLETVGQNRIARIDGWCKM